MNELVIQLCERLKLEADAIIGSMKSGAIVIQTGHENSVETVSDLQSTELSIVKR